MSSPMVERVREIPLIVDQGLHMDCEDSGFPFDDDTEDQEDSRFRSQLDDLTVRHPELAQHLGSFPFRSGSRTRSHLPEHFGHSRFADRPFGERFGFPFENQEEEEATNQKPYYQRYPKYYPTQQQESGEQSSCSSNRETQGVDDAGACRKEEQEIEREKRPKKNIQQSNTVDLGQPQEPVDDRNQRSMSAPPPNDRPRFVSSINIPVNQPAEKPHHDAPQMSSQPQERVIPIHVEGRDEPIIPKKFASQNASSQPHHQAHHPQPQPSADKFFTNRTPNFSQYFQRDQPFQNDWLPRGFHAGKPQAQSQSQRGRSPQPQPQSKTEPAAQAQATRQAQQPQKTVDEPIKPQEVPPKCQTPMKNDPINQIKSIQKDVSELMAQVDQFTGKPRDKQYLYLDEMLTRNLIKLDNIDTQGQENIRLARKEAIKCIEKCISILETKANANVENKGKENAASGEKAEDADKPMDVDKIEENASEEKSMDIVVADNKVPISKVASEGKVAEQTNQTEMMDTTSEVKTEDENPESKVHEDKSAETAESENKKMDVEEKIDSAEPNKDESKNEQEMEVKSSDEKKEKKKLKKTPEKK